MKPKELIWVKRPGKLIAETEALSYEIITDYEAGFSVYSNAGISSTRNFSKPVVKEGVATIDEAKYAAQEHFNAAIMACLE
jgi:hypothetical protein